MERMARFDRSLISAAVCDATAVTINPAMHRDNHHCSGEQGVRYKTQGTCGHQARVQQPCHLLLLGRLVAGMHRGRCAVPAASRTCAHDARCHSVCCSRRDSTQYESPSHRQPFCMLLILELADIDLTTFLDNMQRPLAPPLAKCIMQHILRGLAACHAHGAAKGPKVSMMQGLNNQLVVIIMNSVFDANQHHPAHQHPFAGILHRDLKPSNILAVSGRWKLADFGQSRPEPEPGAPGRMSADVCTRWYRAPELLYGSRAYGAAVDMWAAGCIFAELLGT